MSLGGPVLVYRSPG